MEASFLAQNFVPLMFAGLLVLLLTVVAVAFAFSRARRRRQEGKV